MSEIKQVWAIDFLDLEPLPALLRKGVDGQREVALYNRRDKCFGRFETSILYMPQVFDTFDECRIETIAQQMQALRDAREHAHQLASRIEHVKSLPIATFPDAPQIQEQQQAEERLERVQGEAAQGEEAQSEEVKPAAPAPQQIKRPTRKN